MRYAVEYNYTNVTGMPIRFIGVPFPVAGQPREVHRRYVRGNDMLTGKPMMPAIVEHLQSPSQRMKNTQALRQRQHLSPGFCA
jgi:hypothetical protein